MDYTLYVPVSYDYRLEYISIRSTRMPFVYLCGFHIFIYVFVIDWVYPPVVDKFIIYSRDISERPYQFWIVLLTVSVLPYRI